MPQSKSVDLSSKVVIIGGKRLTVSDVRKSFAELEFLTKGGAMKVVDVLLNAQEPLTREQIAKKAGLSTGYTVDILNKLTTYDYVVGFHIGKRKTIYYAATEIGYTALSNKRNDKEIKTEKKQLMDSAV